MYCWYGDGNGVQAPSRNVKTLQRKLLELDPAALPQFGPDGGYGDETAAAFARLVPGAGDGKAYDEVTIPKMDREYARVFGTGGVVGGEVHIEIPGISIPPETIVVPVVPTGSK